MTFIYNKFSVSNSQVYVQFLVDCTVLLPDFTRTTQVHGKGILLPPLQDYTNLVLQLTQRKAEMDKILTYDIGFAVDKIV